MSVLAQKRAQIGAAIKNALREAQAAGQLQAADLPDFTVENPREKIHGDFATNVAFLLSKRERRAPQQLAQIVLDYLDVADLQVVKTEIAGAGFINFYLAPDWLVGILPRVLAEDETYGCSRFGAGEKIQVEFVSANPTGLLHMGNARGAALGDTLCNALQAAGYEVTREFYINDAGNQIENFGKSLEARYLELLGETVEFPSEGYHGADLIATIKNIVAEVGDQYLKVESALRQELLIQKALQEKLARIREDLADFGVEYDVWFSEQSLHDCGAVAQTVEALRQKGFVEDRAGALWLKVSEFGVEKDEVIVRSNGLATYFAADIAYHQDKFTRGFQQVINIWGADHHGHVARMKGALQALGYDPTRLEIILMQLVRLFRGGEIVRMSKRSGQYITLRELVAEVGRDAARFFFVMRGADSHLDFDLDLAKKESADNPVYYVQYAHARISSILAAETKQNIAPEKIDFTLLQAAEELALVRKIAEFPEEIIKVASSREPHHLTHYAHELASLFHSFYNSCRVLTDEKSLRQARLGLVRATRITLRNVLGLLGVSAPERM